MQKERTWTGMDIKSSRSVIVCFVLLSVLLSPSLKSAAQEKSDINKIAWSELQQIPPGEGMTIQSGLASPFAGVSNEVLIVIGGCNFPNKPVYESGKKRSDRLYLDLAN